MQWSDITRKPGTRALRQFAAAWLVIFLAIATRQYVARGHHQVGLILGAVAVLVGGTGLFCPPAVRWLYIGSMIVTFPIGWLVSQLVLALIFVLVLTPVAVFFRLRGRDVLALKPAPNRTSFWEPKETPKDVRSYFRQY